MDEKIRSQFVEDIKIALKNDTYVEESHIRYLDSSPNNEEKYKFLVELYQHWFDYFIRNNETDNND